MTVVRWEEAREEGRKREKKTGFTLTPLSKRWIRSNNEVEFGCVCVASYCCK
jgi:hypothetical protein